MCEHRTIESGGRQFDIRETDNGEWEVKPAELMEGDHCESITVRADGVRTGIRFIPSRIGTDHYDLDWALRRACIFMSGPDLSFDGPLDHPVNPTIPKDESEIKQRFYRDEDSGLEFDVREDGVDRWCIKPVEEVPGATYKSVVIEICSFFFTVTPDDSEFLHRLEDSLDDALTAAMYFLTGKSSESEMRTSMNEWMDAGKT